VRIVVDTGVFSASISRHRRQRFEIQIALMAGNQIFLAAATVSELRYGALVAGWSEGRRERLEESIQATTVVPVTNKLLTTTAELRFALPPRRSPAPRSQPRQRPVDRSLSSPHRRTTPHRRRRLRTHPQAHVA